jgi:hypothetical protein
VPPNSSENRLSENQGVPLIRSGDAARFQPHVRTEFATRRVQHGFRRFLCPGRSASRPHWESCPATKATRIELGERIFVHLGPGSARDVITQLLNGSQFNYVILSLPSDPGGITRLILSRASSAGERASSDAPALPVSDSAENQLYGAGFGVDPDAPAEPVPSQPTGAAAASGGAKLSGEDLDRMQKMQIQQEQQQLRQLQLQQQPQN